jgi:hypothetical protein
MNSPNKFMMTLQVRYVSITNNMTTGSNIRNMGQKQNSHGKTICALSKLRVDQAHMQMIVKYTIPRVNGSTKICTSTNHMSANLITENKIVGALYWIYHNEETHSKILI